MTTLSNPQRLHKTKTAPPRNAQAARQTYFWIGVPVLVLLLIAFVLGYRSMDRRRLQALDSSAKQESLVSVKAVQTISQDITRLVRCSSVIKAWQQAVILSDVAGQVRSISAKVGDPLQPRDPILKIDDEMYTYTVEQARATVLQLEAKHATSKRELARKKSLLKNNVISDYEFDYAGAKEKADRALLDSAKVSLKIAKRDLRETLIASPIRGILAERIIDIGTNIARGTKLATVVDIDRVKIKVGVSEMEIAEIKEGQKVSITTDAYPDRPYTGSVYSVGTKADDFTLSFPIEIEIVNDRAPILKPGMVARAAIKTGTYAAVIALSQEAVQQNNGHPFVWTVTNERARKVFVTPAAVNGSQVLIKEGLETGQTVVVSGHNKLYEDCRVRVIQ